MYGYATHLSPGSGRRFAVGFPLIFLALLALGPSLVAAQDYRVYMNIADPAEGTVAGVAQEVAAAVETAGWTVVSQHEAGVPEECPFAAHVLTVDWPEWTEAALSRGSLGAFAAPLRVSVFEDELGCTWPR